MQVKDWVYKQAGKIADKFQHYKFFVKHTPEHIDSSTRLYLNVYSSRDEEAMVPCMYRWYRIHNGITSEVTQYKGNTFICQPSDVGAILQAQVTSIDQQYPGTALLKYGPVAIDVLLKQTIESALSTGEGKFQIDLGHQDRIKQCSLQVCDDYMRIAHCNSSAHFKFYYCLGQPLINTLPKDLTNIIIVFPQKYQSETIKFLTELWNDFSLSKQQRNKDELVITLKFINRRAKDEFLFVMKGFIAKRQLKSSNAIKKIEKMDVDSANINFLLEIQSLRKDLLRLSNINKRTQQQKKVYMQETIKLQKEIEDIISSYTKLIEGKFRTKQEFQTSFIQFQNRKDNALNHKYQKIEDQNAKLKEYIRQKLDGEAKQVDLEQLKETEGRVDYNTSPFKKKEPFAEIQSKRVGEYQQLLQNLDDDEEDEGQGDRDSYKKMQADRQRLEHKFNRSLLKIEKLQGQLDRLNRSAVVAPNEANLSFSRNNMSALDVSTTKVVEEKSVLDKKYAKLKEDYLKLKDAYNNLKSKSQTGESKSNQGSINAGNKQNQRLRSAMSAMEREKQEWKTKAEELAAELRKERYQNQEFRQKSQRKIYELSRQIQISRKNSDVMNRSQHLSMQMDEYNTQQNEILKQQNKFLQSQNERLTKRCEKYKSEYKKIKESRQQNGDSLLV